MVDWAAGGGVPARKALVRRRLLAARRALPPAALDATGPALATATLALPEVTRSRVVAAYVSVGREPPTAELLAALLARGSAVLLPVLLPDLDLDWAPYRPGEPLVPGPRGLLQPAADAGGRDALAAADVVVVPALAVDRQGRRLGRGGGSYDRALARSRPDATVVALLHDGELLDEVPAESHDRGVDVAVTPSGGAVRLRQAG